MDDNNQLTDLAGDSIDSTMADLASKPNDEEEMHHHRQPSDHSKLNDIRRSKIYKKLTKAIIPPLQSSITYISSNPVFPFDETALINELMNLQEPEPPADESKAGEDDIDMALPVGEQKPLNYFLNMLASGLVYAGLANLHPKHLLSLRDVENSQSPMTETPEESKKADKDCLAYGVFETDSEESSSDEEEQEEPSSPKSVADQTFYDASLPLHDEDEDVSKLLESLTLNKDLDQLYQEEIKNYNDNRKETEHIATPVSSKTDRRNYTRFQQSVVDNLHPNVLKEGFLTTLKSKGKDEEDKHEKGDGLLIKIADRLKQVFELSDEDYFYTNYQVWLIKDVLLLGHLYLTKDAILFFAFLPKHSSGSITDGESTNKYSGHDDSSLLIHSGTLGMKRAQYGDSYFSTMITHRFWAILRPDTLTIYRSTTDLYFPMFVIDLKLALRAEIIENEPSSTSSPYTMPKPPSHRNSFDGAKSPRPTLRPSGLTLDTLSTDDDSDVSSFQDTEENQESVSSGAWFKLVTKKKSYKFHTDNIFAARQWVNSLTKLIFQLQNSNSRNEVLIKIPIANIIGFRKADVLVVPGVDDDLGANERPLSFGVKYFEEEEDSTLFSKRMKKKFDYKKKKKGCDNILDDDGSQILQNADDKSHINVKDLYFLFFRDAEDFFNIFNQVIYDHQAENNKSSDNLSVVSSSFLRGAKQMVRSSTSSSTSSRAISTLSEYTSSQNTIVDQLIAHNRKLNNHLTLVENPFSQYKVDVTPNSLTSPLSVSTFNSDTDKSCGIEPFKSQSSLKKFGKGLTTKLFTKSGRNSSTRSLAGHSSTPSLNENALPSKEFMKNGADVEHLNNVNDPSSNILHMPKNLSVHAIKNLNMSFETSPRDAEVAESRYTNEIKDYVTPQDYDPEESKAHELQPKSSRSIMEPPLFITPLNLTDPSEYKQDTVKKKSTPLKSIGKNLKSFSMGNMWSSQPNHYEEILEADPYYIKDLASREVAQSHFQEHFSLNNDKDLIASYYTHLQRALPVYGKLYIGTDQICFRSLLPGVSTKMILPIEDIENCYKEKGLKLTYSSLVIVIKGHDELFLEFSSASVRDDCEAMVLRQLESFHKDEPWVPQPHEWGANYDYGLELTLEDQTYNVPSSMTLENSRIENARIKLFEDKLKLAGGLDMPIILEDSPFFKTEIKPTTSFNFTLLTIGSRGDVQPYIALSLGLRAEGHNVTIATHKEFEPWVLLHGINFKEIAGNPAELMQLMVQHGSMSVAFLKKASSQFRSWINDLLSSSWEACQGTDILIESPSAMGGIHIAEALGIPYMRAFTMPWTRTRAYPHAFIVPDQKKGGSYNYLTHVMFENVFWKGISGQVNRWRVEELGLPRTNLFKLQQSKIPFLYNISPIIFPPSVDFPDWVRVTGYWFLDEGQSEKYDAPQELIDFIDAANRDNKRLVYIGFGSIVVNDSKSLTQAVIDAVLQADVRCILNKGWSDRLNDKKNTEVELPLPPEIYNSGAIPHDWLFPRIHAAVHHGGSGTTGATLRFGLPTVIKPFFGDQFFYASRIEDIGVGVALKNLNAKSLAKALTTVTLDLKMIEKAKKASERLRQENGVLVAVETIYSELEYAKSLIVAKQQQNELARQHDYRSPGTMSGFQTPMSGAHTPTVDEDDELTDSEDDESLSELESDDTKDV